MDREKYKSYTRAVVVALNDYFSREYRNEADPYLETREKEECVFGKSGNSYPGWSKRIRPDGYGEEPAGNTCTVCKRIGGWKQPDKWDTDSGENRLIRRLISGQIHMEQ